MAPELFLDKIVLAPMVRVSALPFRLLALDYGADIVYTEEIVDYKMLKCQRIVNKENGIIEYSSGEDEFIFQICPEREKDKLIFQIGTCDPERALKVAKLVENDVAAIDVNMGCPKTFSIQGGMGAVLLSQPDKVEKILTTLVQGLTIPVSCKIRLLSTLEESLNLCRLIESCGVSALTIHGRTKDERPRHSNRNDQIAAISDALSIPVIANGGSGSIHCFDDIEKFRDATRCSSVMLARSALKNPSIFNRSGKDSLENIIQNYLKYCFKYHTCVAHVKYVIQRMIGEQQQSTERGQQTLHACNFKEICDAWGFDYLYEERGVKRKISQTEDGIEIMDVFIPNKRLRRSDRTPKNVLNDWCTKKGLIVPKYLTTQKGQDRRFHTTVIFQDRRFASKQLQINKKISEQAAAFVALHCLNLKYLLPGDWDDLFTIN